LGLRGPRSDSARTSSIRWQSSADKARAQQDNVDDTEISAELLRLFTRWQQLDKVYGRCLKGGPCRSPDPDRLHCAQCVECIEISNRMREITNPRTWECSGIGADAPEPPDYLNLDSFALAAWHRAWRLHCALIKAAKRARFQVSK
jgi:hypothetical protein